MEGLIHSFLESDLLSWADCYRTGGLKRGEGGEGSGRL